MKLFLAVMTAAFLLVGPLPTAADAHRGTKQDAIHRVVASNMYHQCGNGWASYCYGAKYAFVVRAADAHSWLLHGYWQERRIGGHRGLFACTALFVSGPHGTGWLPYSESCRNLRK